MFDTVLVANRGEIAVRVIRTLRDLGIRSVAVFSDADADALHVRRADVAVRIGPPPAGQSYLDVARILAAAASTGAQAIHPGYGFLSENAAFARACADEGVVFVGPPTSAIEAMGDKISAKATVSAAGVPVVPGRSEHGLTDEDLASAAEEVGYPVLLKPSAGGGGKGMRLVHDGGAIREQIAAARREAASSFGNDALLLERFIDRPRHIEIQVLADTHGNVLHLGERECSLQRRHQKVIEEAPSSLLDVATRDRMGRAAAEAARSVRYTGAGTVEFIVSSRRPEEFFFMEMNTRLQVEHPVTELVTGLDLVEWQLRVAAGERLALTQDEVRLDGHGVEARIYAEDPARGFLPTGGRVLLLREPTGPHVRVDSGISEGIEVGSTYDPMLAKVIAWGPDRNTALRRLDGALADTAVLGLRNNIAFLRAVLVHPDVAAGRLDTGLIERDLAQLVSVDVPEDVLAAAGLERLLALEPAAPVVDPWDLPTGWRLGERAWATWRIETAGRAPVEVRVRGSATAAEVSVGGGDPVPARASLDDAGLHVTCNGCTRSYSWVRAGDVLWLGRDGHTWALAEQERLAAARSDHAGATGGTVRSPMPGTVLSVRVASGDSVAAGQPLLVVEAMKMEHTITAPVDGIVTELLARTGEQVAMDAPLITVTAAPSAGAS